MKNLIILGSTSNICKIRVFDNLNNINIFDTIYCYGWENWDTSEFLNYFFTNIKLNNTDNISKKIKFIKGDYTQDNYKKLLTNLISNTTIIYVSTPPICYLDILKFFNTINTNYKLILEKPLCKNYIEFNKIKNLLSQKVILCDHFIYKQDVIDIINRTSTEIYKLEIHFLYKDDVESRLGYFDQVGFFIDMFPTHYLSIINKINNDLLKTNNIKINKNIRKQYNNYGGNNSIDTYFYTDMDINNVNCIFEAGKSFNKSEKYIIINDNYYKIHNYTNEYELFFNDVITDTYDIDIIKNQTFFWNLTNLLVSDFYKNGKLKYYDKNISYENINID